MTDANIANISSTAFPTPFSHLQHLLILGWKTGQSQDKAEPPGATEHEDGDEERLARARETEREEAMVFLDALVNYGCRRWLHKEDFSFE